jgi:hypothetical protein
MFSILAFADTVLVAVKNGASNPAPVSGSVNATIVGTPAVNANDPLHAGLVANGLYIRNRGPRRSGPDRSQLAAAA